MTRLQVALSAAMAVHDLVPMLFADATFAMAVTGAFSAFVIALALMFVDAWRKMRGRGPRKGGRS